MSQFAVSSQNRLKRDFEAFSKALQALQSLGMN